MNVSSRFVSSLAAIVLFNLGNLYAQEFTDQQLEFFESKVRPLLIEHCYECHGPDSDREGGLNLSSRQSILEGGDSGPAIDLKNSEKSLILDAVAYGDLFQMPPDSKLPDEDIAILRKWVAMDAPWPHNENVTSGKVAEFDLQKRRNEHWCWQPIVRPPIPQVDDPAWASDSLDKFVLRKLEQNGLRPAQPVPSGQGAAPRPDGLSTDRSAIRRQP